MSFDFFHEMQAITDQYCELNGLPVRYRCAGYRNCDSLVERKGDMCPACERRLDNAILDSEERVKCL